MVREKVEVEMIGDIDSDSDGGGRGRGREDD